MHDPPTVVYIVLDAIIALVVVGGNILACCVILNSTNLRKKVSCALPGFHVQNVAFLKGQPFSSQSELFKKLSYRSDCLPFQKSHFCFEHVKPGITVSNRKASFTYRIIFITAIRN